ncbi:OmpA family protein, partial [Rhizobium brockwellii]
MIVHGHRISLALGLLMAPCIGFAQQLDNTQIMTTLGQVKAAAPAVDVALLVEEANANVGKGVSTLPNWN